MAGNEDNPNINTGINQVIKAINDLVTQLISGIQINCPDITINLPAPIVNVTMGGCSPNCAPGGGTLVPPEESPGQTEPGGGPGGYDPPESWEGTPEEYETYKCKAATFLADAYLTYVAKFSLFASIGLTSITVTMFFAPMPEAFMALVSPALAFALFAFELTIALAGNVLAGYLGMYYENLDNTKSQFICDLYNAPTVEDARTVILAWISDNLPSGLGSIPGFADYHVDNLFPVQVINILFEEYTPVNDVTGEDCSECIAPFQVWNACSEERVDGSEPFEIIGELQCGTPNPALYGMYLKLRVEPEGTPDIIAGPPEYYLDLNVTSGSITTPEGSGYNTYYWVDEDEAIVLQQDTFTNAQACRGFQIVSSTAFTADVTLTEVP